MKKAIFLLLWVVFSLALHAQESQTIYNFLRLPVSSHAAALGGDNISLIEDDAALTIHNPALLASVSDRTLNLGYMNYMSGANLFSAGYAFAPMITGMGSICWVFVTIWPSFNLVPAWKQ